MFVIFDYCSLNKSLMAAFSSPLGKTIILQRVQEQVFEHRIGIYITSNKYIV